VVAYRGGRNAVLATFPAMSHRVAVLVFPGFQLLDAAQCRAPERLKYSRTGHDVAAPQIASMTAMWPKA
jgi:hypothetical protein